MDKFKAFFEKKKLDAKFKKAGGGHTLAAEAPANRSGGGGHTTKSPTTPAPHGAPSAAQVAAAQAALQRFEITQKTETRSQQAIKLQVKKQLEEESKRLGNTTQAAGTSRGPEEKTLDHAPVMVADPAVAGVFFTCEMLGDDVVLPKDKMAAAVADFLQEQAKDEPLFSSVLMIHSLNQAKERQTAIETLCKYLDNLIQNPAEEKFRKIRMGNQAFQDRVLAARGGREFLHAVGFREESTMEGQFLVIPSSLAAQPEVETAKDMLVSGEPMPLKLYRNPAVLLPSSRPLKDVKLPDAFFERTGEEVKKEQQWKTEEVDRQLSLRTKEMRNRDEIQRIYKYRYCLLRIKFPEGYMLQGTFGAAETFREVRGFVANSLDTDWAPFLLKGPGGEVLDEKRDDTTIADLGLAPAALLHFTWEPEFEKSLIQAGKQPTFVKEEWLRTAQSL